jgi:hypothetical protein
MRHKVTTELRYPGLWRGCVGAWNPGLGPTGLTLRDWSGRGNHATMFAGMTSSAWVPSPYGAALRFNGSAGALQTTAIGGSTSQFTVVAWAKRSGSLAANASLFASRASGQIGLVESFAATDTITGTWNGTGSEWNNPGIALADNTWSFMALSVDRTNLRVIVNRTAINITITETVRTLGAFVIGADDLGALGRVWGGDLAMLQMYDRVLTEQELNLFRLRPGIAYEMAPRRRSSVAVAGGGFNAAWIPRRSLIIGGGTN